MLFLWKYDNLVCSICQFSIWVSSLKPLSSWCGQVVPSIEWSQLQMIWPIIKHELIRFIVSKIKLHVLWRICWFNTREKQSKCSVSLCSKWNFLYMEHQVSRCKDAAWERSGAASRWSWKYFSTQLCGSVGLMKRKVLCEQGQVRATRETNFQPHPHIKNKPVSADGSKNKPVSAGVTGQTRGPEFKSLASI